MCIKTTVSSYFIFSGMAIIKKTITNVSEDVEKLESSYIAIGNINVATMENRLAISQKLNILLPYNPTIPLLAIYSDN